MYARHTSVVALYVITCYTELRYNVSRLYGDWEAECKLMTINICINQLIVKDSINVYT